MSELPLRLDEHGRCLLCRGDGEVWMSGRMVPCRCPAVATINYRLRERVAELEARVRAMSGGSDE